MHFKIGTKYEHTQRKKEEKHSVKVSFITAMLCPVYIMSIFWHKIWP